jgi:excisionase family DNA binding protein
MRKPVPDLNGSAPAAPMCRPSNPDVAAPTAGDALIEAIANAVALKLERMAGMQQRLMDVHDAARYLGMTENAIREKASAGELPCVRIDGKLRFDRRELDRWIDRAPRQGV